MKLPVVTISGSMMFKETMLEVACKLSAEGYVVLLPFPDPELGPEGISDEKMEKHMKAHFDRIDMSDILYVVNKDNYIGKATSKEIDYAMQKGKRVLFYYNQEDAIISKIEQFRDIAGTLKRLSDELSLHVITARQSLDDINNHPKIVTLCGSTKFTEKFYEIKDKFSLQGIVCFIPEIFNFDPKSLSAEQHEYLDKIHQTKIDMSDEVLIVNPGGYVGDNTKEEIKYARLKGKKITFLEMTPELSCQLTKGENPWLI